MSDGRDAAVRRLRDMVDAAGSIAGYVGRGRAAYDNDAAVREAILYQIVVLGEAAKAALAAEPSLETTLSGVEWSPIARMRDKVAHHYWALDRDLVWMTATVSVPELRRALLSALETLAR